MIRTEMKPDQIFIQEDKKIDHEEIDHGTFMELVAENQLDKIKEQYDKIQNQTLAFHYVCLQGKTDVIKIFIEKGFDVNTATPNDDKNTGLHLACEKDRLEAIKFLTENGANIDLENYEKHTPLTIALQKDNKEIIELLMKNYPLKIKINDQLTINVPNFLKMLGKALESVDKAKKNNGITLL